MREIVRFRRKYRWQCSYCPHVNSIYRFKTDFKDWVDEINTTRGKQYTAGQGERHPATGYWRMRMKQDHSDTWNESVEDSKYCLCECHIPVEEI